MFSRTMSYLSLSVIAAAVFLVSGCVPIDNEGEQVPQLRPERIEQLEQDVAAVKPAVAEAMQAAAEAKQAVAAVKPAVTEAMQAAGVVKEGKFADLISEAVETNERLRNRIIDSLCNNQVTLRLIDVDRSFIEALKKNPELIRHRLVPDKLKPIKPSSKTYEHSYDDLSAEQFEIVRGAIKSVAANTKTRNGTEQVVLDEGKLRRPCGQLAEQKGELVYVSVSGDPGGDTGRVYALSIKLTFHNPFRGSRVWLVPQTGHWLTKATGHIANQQKRSKIAQIFGATGGIEITGPGSAGGKWNGNTWEWKVTSNLSVPPIDLISDDNTVVYAMVARKVTSRVAGKPNIFRVVQYRKFKIDSPSGTFPEEPIELKDPLEQPACPPSSGILHSNAQTSFRSFLATFYPQKGCKEQ